MRPHQRILLPCFKKIAHEQNKCIILVTHEQEVAAACDAVYELKNKEFQQLIR